MRGVRLAYAFCGLLFISSMAIYFSQGGFGGGHGSSDLLLRILGLPWVLIPWPIHFPGDFVWLSIIPFVLNVALVSVVRFAFRKFKAHPPSW